MKKANSDSLQNYFEIHKSCSHGKNFFFKITTRSCLLALTLFVFLPPVLTDTQDTSPQPSEEMLSSQSELRSSKYHQDRELPSIPPNNALIGDGLPASGDSTYEVSTIKSPQQQNPHHTCTKLVCSYRTLKL